MIGRNGAGKTSLLRLITGRLEPDDGEIHTQSRIRVSELEQALPEELRQTVREYVTTGLADLQALIDLYQQRSQETLDRKGLLELEALHREIDAHGGWHLDQRVDTVLSELDLPADRRLEELSGGWQRRVGLARAIVGNAELLLLDEPTNHLDLSTIQWLEDRVYNYAGSVLFITHDRAFLRRLATRIVELDRTRLTSWPGNY
ncbi:ATP-binding protein Uup [Geodia barretti]|uniref:ATP-binding protein Uup n=1 Tax=Geodia barretti TaxID=519541 RepID=A0AA35QRF4_GEOBA|nr:ATP-binding protein Uup [Geodia barretti]